MKCIGALLILAACSGGGPAQYPGADTTIHTSMAEDEEAPPPYDKAAISKALPGERAAESRAERAVTEAEAAGDHERLRVAIADLAVRQRFIQTLELCEAQGRL